MRSLSYTPIKDGSYYVVSSVRPSVRPLTFRVRYITLIPFKIFSWNLVQVYIIIRQCAQNKNRHYTYIFYGIIPLWIFSYENRVCFDTVENIFMNLCTNINNHQTMCRWNYAPLKFLIWKSCQLYNFNTVENIFMKLCTNINHHQTMRGDKKR